MTKAEIRSFIEEMKSIGDVWTEEEAERCYSNLSLRQALDTRKSEVGQFLSSLGTAAIYLDSKETNEKF